MSEDKVEIAPTGNARCRACREYIAEGSARFGEWLDSYLNYESDSPIEPHHGWYHLECAAIAKSTALLRVLRSENLPPVAAREWYAVKATIGVLRRKNLDVEEVLWFHDDGKELPHTIFRTTDDRFALVTRPPRNAKTKSKRQDGFAVDYCGSADDAFALLPEALFRVAKKISVSRTTKAAKKGARASKEAPRAEAKAASGTAKAGKAKTEGPPDADESVGACPSCQKAQVAVRGGMYACQSNCGFRFSRTILQQSIEPEQLAKWLSEAACTDFLNGFVSKKTGRPFSARLVRNGTKMEFQFPERG